MSKIEKIYTCPRINNFIRPTPEYLTCSNCGEQVEIWSDEDEVECDECGNNITREKVSCLEYCEFADQCRGIINQRRLK